jgi:SAM-dependent methyltransferase
VVFFPFRVFRVDPFMTRNLTESFYPETRLFGFTRLDGTIAFYSRVNALLSPASVVVDFGCGRGAYGADPVAYRRDLRILKGKAARVIGLDVSSAGAQNPYLDEFCPLQGDAWPLPSASIDMVLCDNVLEHLPNPGVFFSQASRVLKPSGVACIRTPNAWNYIAILSRLIPSKDHAGVLTRVKDRISEEDIFPTLYRCNSLGALKKELNRNGFAGAVYGYEAEPSYLSFSVFAYALGVLHQRLALGFLRASLFAFAQKIR